MVYTGSGQALLIFHTDTQCKQRKGRTLMINLEKEIREQPAVLAQVKDTNMDTIRTIVADIKAGRCV